MNYKKEGFTLAVMVIIALLMIGVANSGFNPQAPGGGLDLFGNPTVTPYPTATYPPYPDIPTPTVYSTFALTQRLTEEYVYDYSPPTSSKNAGSIQTVIVDPDFEPYTHAVGVWGTFANWNFDIYVQVGSDEAFWFYADSGITDEFGAGYGEVPFDVSNAGLIHNMVAVLNPDGGLPASYGGFTAGELIGLVNDGTLVQSNHLSFDVIASMVL